MYKIMTAGPVQVRENVRMARSLPCTNPDLDLEFYEFYKETCNLFSKALGTESRTLILGGEGILGLEAACASLTEPGDRGVSLALGLGKYIVDGGLTLRVCPYHPNQVLQTSEMEISNIRPVDKEGNS